MAAFLTEAPANGKKWVCIIVRQTRREGTLDAHQLIPAFLTMRIGQTGLDRCTAMHRHSGDFTHGQWFIPLGRLGCFWLARGAHEIFLPTSLARGVASHPRAGQWGGFGDAVDD